MRVYPTMLLDPATMSRLITATRSCLLLLAITLIVFACAGNGTAPNAHNANAAASDVAAASTAITVSERPNILLIVADDLGYSDLGVFGSEIRTPNLDRLAREGVLFTQFYTSPMCSPTRAMLLSGIDNHLVGLGNMAERLADNQRGQAGYEGHLNSRVASLPEVLQSAGYRTYMTGKWHLGGADVGADPSQRGFEKSFVLLDSGAGAFSNMLPLMGPKKADYSDNGQILDRLPDDFYSTRFYAEKLIEYLEEDQGDDRPFFAYLAFTAAHFPLQAPAESMARYQGKYDQGYEALHSRRLKTLQELGLVGRDVVPFPASLAEPAWARLSPTEQAYESRRMEIYAAMIDDLDRYVGKVIDTLKAQGSYDNTVIVFMSDNGAEGHYLRHGLGPLAGWAKECCNNNYDNMGKADSYVMLGPNWARASTAPFRMYKGFTSEGGVRTPAFIHFPARIPGGRQSAAPVTVKDVMPTLLGLARAVHPAEMDPDQTAGPRPLAMQGISMLAHILGKADSVHGENFVMAWELFGKRAVRQGDWKIIWETRFVDWWDSAPFGIKREQWQLYNLATDPAELNDLYAQEPEQSARLIKLWNDYVQLNGVIIPDTARGY